MRRREFIAGLGGAAAWPLAATAQQPERVRRVVVLMGIANDADAQARVAALHQGLQELGWTIGRNIQIEYRFADGDAERIRAYAKETVASAPDLILAQSNPVLIAVREATRSQPIVFIQVSDPVGGGFVENLARPGGNITGFTNFESEMGGKWLQTLKEIAPAVERVAVVVQPETSAHAEFLRSAETASKALQIKVAPPRCAQRRRDRARDYRVRPLAEGRDDCGTASHNKRTFDYRPCRPLSFAFDLSISILCERRWSGFLWNRPSRSVSTRGHIR
jgi:ABC transporter substrate binding protein